LDLVYAPENKTSPITWPFDQPFYLRLGLAVGTEGGYGGPPDESMFPADFEIDFVRVYEQI